MGRGVGGGLTASSTFDVVQSATKGQLGLPGAITSDPCRTFMPLAWETRDRGIVATRGVKTQIVGDTGTGKRCNSVEYNQRGQSVQSYLRTLGQFVLRRRASRRRLTVPAPGFPGGALMPR